MKITKTEMATTKFMKIRDNPIQRDTELHAKKAKKRHLKTYHERHRVVAIAKLGGDTYLLDGHTRIFLWKSGDLKMPETVIVDVYKVDSMKEMLKLYECFDNSFAAETKAEQIIGAINYLGFKNYSPNQVRNLAWMQATRCIDVALKRYNPNTRVIEKLTPYKKEIGILLNQNWDVNYKQVRPGIPSCVVAAFLILIKLYNTDSLGFWDGYYSGKGRTLRSGMDGSQAAANWIKKARKNKELMGIENTPCGIMAILNAYVFYRKRKPVEKLSQLYKYDSKLSTMMQLRIMLEELGYR